MAAFDMFRRAAGLPTESDRDQARSYREQLAASQDPGDAFAAAIADKVSTYGLDQANRALPELAQGGGKWSRDPDQRWADVARAARGIADAVRAPQIPGLDPKLSASVDRQFLEDAAARYNGRNSVARHAAAERTALTDRVRSVVSGGRFAEETAFQHVVSVEKVRNLRVENRLAGATGEHVAQPRDSDRQRHREWLLHSTRAYLAMARTGLLQPDEVVGYAREARDFNPTPAGAIKPIDWSVRHKAMTPEIRQEVVRDEIRVTLESLGTTPKHPSWEMPPKEQIPDLARVADVEWLRGDREPARPSRNETVGERAGQEIREALAGRLKMGERWLAPEGTMLPQKHLENGTTEDLHSARVGRIESIKDEGFRAEMVKVARHAKERYVAPEPELGFPVKSANTLIRDMALQAAELVQLQRFEDREFPDRTLQMGPVPLSEKAQAEIRAERGRLRMEKHGVQQDDIVIPGVGSRGYQDELGHRYMAIMLRDAYDNHPLVGRKLDRHADELRRNDPERNEKRGVNISTPIEDARRLTVAHEAERHMDMHFGRAHGYQKDGVDFRHIYAKELRLPAPDEEKRRPSVAVTAARASFAQRQMGG